MPSDEKDEIQKKSKLPLALGIAVAVTILLTVVSVAIYYIAGFYKLDLSRPGYEVEREDITATEAAPSYDDTSPLSAEAVDKILQDFDSRVRNIESYGDFNSDSLSDENVLTNQ